MTPDPHSLPSLFDFLPLKFVFQIYPVTKKSIENRVALLITNINFTDRTLNRYGADRDEANMKNVLRGLGYEVVPHRDLTGDVSCKKGNERIFYIIVVYIFLLVDSVTQKLTSEFLWSHRPSVLLSESSLNIRNSKRRTVWWWL